MAQLKAGYLFPEIARIRNAHLEKNPDAKIISLGIGDTTEPIPKPITDGMVAAAAALGTKEGYSAKGGYGPEAGQMELRKAIAEKLYKGTPITYEDVFASDGSKCDI